MPNSDHWSGLTKDSLTQPKRNYMQLFKFDSFLVVSSGGIERIPMNKSGTSSHSPVSFVFCWSTRWCLRVLYWEHFDIQAYLELRRLELSRSRLYVVCKKKRRYIYIYIYKEGEAGTRRYSVSPRKCRPKTDVNDTKYEMTPCEQHRGLAEFW